MGMNEDDPIRKRNDGSVLTMELATRLNEFTDSIPDNTKLESLVEIRLRETVLHQIRDWFKTLATLDPSQRGQIVRTLTAFKNSGIETVEQLRGLPNMDPKYIKGLKDIDHVRYDFIKQLFPVPTAK